MNMGNLLNENRRRSNIIRSFVKDIIKIYKTEDDGEFYLPNFLYDDYDFYNFPGFNHNIVLEVVLIKDDNVTDFVVDSDYWRNEDIIEVRIKYNPNVKSKIIYDLVGELNEIVAHEVRHIDQKYKSLYNLDGDDVNTQYEYYTQDHELDAQRYGFKRLSKITKKPFEQVVKNWFITHKDIHLLNDGEMEDVILKIINFKN